MIRWRPVIACLVGLTLLCTPLFAQRGRPIRLSGPHFRSGEVIVGYRDSQAVKATAAIQKQFGGSVVKSVPRLRMNVMRNAQASRDVYAFCRALKKLPGVRYAEPNFYRRLLLNAPNDPAYNNIDSLIAPFDPDMDPSDYTWFQWGLHKIEALAAWSVYPNTYYTSATRPAGAPKIAVVDTGIDDGGTDGIAHPDFINAGGSSPNAALGGQIDVTDGRNVISGANATDFADDYGHGTAVAGVIGAATNNGGNGDADGIAGLAYNCQVMPVKTFDNTGNGTAADTATAVQWAVDHGALVVNISAGDVDYSQAEQDAIDYAWDHGTIVVCASGNEGDGANRPFYPAACAGALGVGATSWPGDDAASYSNFGSYVGISAPGGDVSLIPLSAWLIWTTVPTEDVPIKAGGLPESGSYQYHTGTSLACPYVAGLAGLYASRFGITQGTSGGVLRMFRALQRGCDNPAGTPGWNPNWGWGRINAYQTLLDANNRGATVGCITGQLSYVDTVIGNATVRAKLPGTATVVGSATTRNDGTFRITNIAAGTYDVSGSYLGRTATIANVQVLASSDTPHVKLTITEGGGGNQPPTAPTSVSVTPAEPVSTDDLVGDASGGSDPDGQTVTYEYKWQKSPDGSAWTDGPAGKTLLASATTSGDHWRVQARSSDGTAFSGWTNSSEVIIANASPVLAGVGISPLSPRSDQDLQATVTGGSDPDGDSVTYRFMWEKSSDDGSTWEPGPTAKVVDAETILRGEQWRVSGRAHDGTAYSAWILSEPVIVRNCPPEPPTAVRLIPTNPTTLSNITATASGGSDSDGDNIIYRYAWYHSPNGTTSWVAGPKGRVLTAGATTAGEYWRVQVRSHDGVNASRAFYSVALKINNARPTKPTSVAITPLAPKDGQNVVGTATGSTDGDGDSLSYRYRWYSSTDGTIWLPGPSKRVLNYAETSVGDQWKVAARAYDGQAYSPWVWSQAVTISGATLAAADLKSVSAKATAVATKGNLVQIVVSLSAPAKVRVEVRNLAGRVVAMLPERPLEQGLSTLLWDGRSSQGTRLPRGTYLVAVEAASQSGSVSRSLTPLQR
ncbi:MAG: S8 family serine peptidase [Armatimonadota bacterium]